MGNKTAFKKNKNGKVKILCSVIRPLIVFFIMVGCAASMWRNPSINEESGDFFRNIRQFSIDGHFFNPDLVFYEVNEGEAMKTVSFIVNALLIVGWVITYIISKRKYSKGDPSQVNKL